ncbi:hypothetical protein SH580_09890 [Coraliomargarita algicola]|uniref:DUF362 domain-containing protein n=1 Tax=Coraliomargarita algicola TaxID=3092156 RepID=A0ABZ0RYE7_9BACT|nr:hypothetical protein [Coraliomargarita sp. J2-16]WPJ98014.1 hypothetical protein SH580_09890 [Coraliomargarita sp. J2-16]
MWGLFLGSSATAALVPRAPLGLVWESPLASGSLYYTEVDRLLAAYEREVGQVLQPGERGQVALKVNTRGRAGLGTPLQLIRALVEALEARGYERRAILIVDYSAYDLREAGVMPPLSESAAQFEGSPVLALDSEQYYDPEWFYDSPLPPALQQEPQLISETRRATELAEGAQGRKSYLPKPLLFEVDFWINLAVGVDDPALGIDGVLANATLWNVSNSRRFLVNQATASAAVAEIAAIPELEERLILNFVSLERYQFIAGPFFNSIYTRSEPRLWMSSDPVALDRLLYDRINTMRVLEGFSEIEPVPRQLPFAASLGLGEFDPDRIHVQKLSLPEEGVRVKPKPVVQPAPEPVVEKQSWLRRVTPW